MDEQDNVGRNSQYTNNQASVPEPDATARTVDLESKPVDHQKLWRKPFRHWRQRFPWASSLLDLTPHFGRCRHQQRKHADHHEDRGHRDPYPDLRSHIPSIGRTVSILKETGIPPRQANPVIGDASFKP